MSNPQYPPPGSGFPPPDNSQGSYPPPGGYTPPSGSYNSYPPPGGYTPPPGNYTQPGGYQPPLDNNPPPYQPYQPPVYGYGQQQMYATPYSQASDKVGFGIRLVAWIIDAIIAAIALGILQSVLPWQMAGVLSWAGYALYAVLTSLYFDGATLGKMAMGIKVVDESGNAPDIVPLILRYLVGYWVSGLILCIGFLMIAFDPQHQGLHDKIAKTYVVYKNRSNNYPRY